jgi:hypothetical protein
MGGAWANIDGFHTRATHSPPLLRS